MDIKQKFYETAYPDKHKKIKLRSTIGFLYLLLKKFEYYREDVIIDLLNNGNSLLDVGCGNGSLVFRLLDKFDRIYGTDIATTRLKEAESLKKRLPKKDFSRIKFIHSDADAKFPFKNSTLDAVTMVATLEHFFDPYYILEDAHRVLRKGGQLIIQVPNLGFLPRRIAVLVGNLPVTSEDETGWDGGHLHYFTVKTTCQLLGSRGFEVKKVTCSGVFARIRSFWTSLLGPDIIIKAVKA